MTVALDYHQRLDAIREAYLQLPEPRKVEMSRAVSKSAPALFKLWFDMAEPPGYSKPPRAADRPPGTGKRFDDALLKSPASRQLLKGIPAAFFQNEREEWVDWVNEVLKHSSEDTIEQDLEAVLRRPDAPFRGDEFEALFVARSLLNPQAWLEPKSEPSGTLAPSVEDKAHDVALDKAPDIAKSPCKRVLEAMQHATLTCDACANLLAEARIAHSFDRDAVIRHLDDLERIGREVRSVVTKMATAAGAPEPSWTSADDLRSKLEALETAAEASRASRQQAVRLKGVAAVLRRVIHVAIRSQARRAAADAARDQAIHELERAAVLQQPPSLPGEGEEASWFKNATGLPESEYNALLQRLGDVRLAALARFLEQVDSWDQVSLADQEPAQSRDGGDEPVAQPPVPPLTAPAPPAQPAPTDSDETIQVRSGDDSASGSPRVPDEPRTTPPAVPVPQPRSDPQEVSPRDQTERVTADQLPSDAAREFGPVLLRLDKEAKRPLLADFVAALPLTAQQSLPPIAVWTALAIQPWLRRPDDDIADRTRRLLSELTTSQYSPGTPWEALLLWSVAIPVAFVDSSSDAAALLGAIRLDLLPPTTAEFTRLTLAFVHEVRGCSPNLIRAGASRDAWDRQLYGYQRELLQTCEQAQSHALAYQRASRVWHKLNKPGGRLHALAALAQGKLTAPIVRQLREGSAELQNRAAVRKLIDHATRELSGPNFEPIIAMSFQQLERRIADFVLVLERLVRHLDLEPTHPEFVVRQVQTFRTRALALIRTQPEQVEIGDSAAVDALARRAATRASQLIASLFDAQSDWAAPTADPKDVLCLTRLRVPKLLVAEDGIQGDVASTRLALTDAATGELASFSDAFEFRSKAGDIANARILLENWEPPLEQTERDNYQSTLEERAAAARERARSALSSVRRSIANARALGVMADSEAAQKVNLLVTIERRSQTSEHYDGVTRDLEAISSELDRHTRAEADKLRREISAHKIARPADQNRLFQLVERGDLATAREYLNRLAQGYELPAFGSDDDPGAFTLQRQSELSSALQAGNDLAGLGAAVRNRGKFAGADYSGFSGTEITDTIGWLEAWLGISRSAAAKPEMLRRFLEGIGFSVISERASQAGGASTVEVQFETITSRAICAIPQFGSQTHGRMRVARFIQRQQPEQLASHVVNLGAGDLVVLVLGFRFEPPLRAEFARLCRQRHLTALAIDDLLVAHLLPEVHQRLAGFFRATMPYSWADPFVPTSSFVPPEMFFGRMDALHSLLDPNSQRCFVYGGRQLGKTALLREVERRFNNPKEGRFGMWIDLLAAGYGVDTEPEEIWRLLENRLSSLPGFAEAWVETKTSAGNRVEHALMAWLNAAPERRLLLLLDEGDRFLDRDAAKDFTQSRVLKGLMDRSKRRCKVVFAGLHNVQRTTKQSNHPLAHLGDPIKVGAFSENGEWMEAYSLLTRPFASMGYRFETADLPSRVLTYCNFYPSMLQQFGSRLLQRVSSARNGPPFVIRDSDVEAVSRDEQFRQFMIDRFRWTLQLDERYYFLAFTYAVLFHEKPEVAARGFTVPELRKYVEEYRPREFSALSQDEFTSLLDEMGGLGIFRNVEQNRYALRNTNVLLLLGSYEEVLEKLLEDAPLAKADYRSGTYRGSVQRNVPQKRRILVRPDENRLLERSNRVVLATGSRALEFDLLAASLQAAAGRCEFKTLRPRTAALLKEQLSELQEEVREEGTHILLVDPRCAWDESWITMAEEFASALRSKTRYFAVVLPCPAESLWTQPHIDMVTRADRLWLSPRRWEEEFIQPWLHELGTAALPSHVAELRDATGGWPLFMHKFAEALKERNSWTEAIEMVRSDVAQSLGQSSAHELFLGAGEAANEAFATFRDLHQLLETQFTTSDLAASTELLRKPLAKAEQLIEAGQRLQIIDRVGERYRWDPLFERVLTRR